VDRDAGDVIMLTDAAATAAHHAAFAGDIDLLQRLRAAGAPLDARLPDGMQPIHWACFGGRVAAVELLLSWRVSHVDATAGKGQSLLALAAQRDQPLVVFCLVKHGADVQLADSSGDTPLHWAAFKGNVQSAALLLYLGASPTAADAYGATPLHLAAQSGAISIIELLLDGEYAEACDGALEAQDAKGRTPHAVAQEHKQAHAASALRSFDRRPSLLRRLVACGSADGSSGSRSSARAAAARTGRGPLFWCFVASLWVVMATHALVLQPPPPSATASASGPAWLHGLFWLAVVAKQACLLVTTLGDPGDVASTAERRAAYNAALELATAGHVDAASQSYGALCHSCHLVRPLRSKHCAVRRRCVGCFDHVCPWVGTTVGGRNYVRFLGFLLTALVANLLHLCASAAFVVGRVRTSTGLGVEGAWVLLLALYLFALLVFTAAMLLYHTQLVLANLTTNEQAHPTRYPYLVDEATGRLANAFDGGLTANLLDLWYRRRLLAADPYIYTKRFAKWRQLVAQMEEAGESGSEMAPLCSQ
jgi:hypothetical protein